jgi:hypothetical protein
MPHGEIKPESYLDEMDPVALLEEAKRLYRRINSPLTDDFLEGVRLEAAHQVERWGTPHDRGKSPFDWFWLIGYLAQKAATAHVDADRALLQDDCLEAADKARHHTISTAAACLNWHAHLVHGRSEMRPGGYAGEKLGQTSDV